MPFCFPVQSAQRGSGESGAICLQSCLQVSVIFCTPQKSSCSSGWGYCEACVLLCCSDPRLSSLTKTEPGATERGGPQGGREDGRGGNRGNVCPGDGCWGIKAYRALEEPQSRLCETWVLVMGPNRPADIQAVARNRGNLRIFVRSLKAFKRPPAPQSLRLALLSPGLDYLVNTDSAFEKHLLDLISVWESQALISAHRHHLFSTKVPFLFLIRE